MAKETNQILGHGADADGIEEYDNPLPDWWLGLFLFTIVAGVGYGINYHFISHDSQVKQYMAQMEEAELKWPTPEGPATVSMDDATIAAGADVFAQTCASCHKADMTGGIGPSLDDAEWIHGNSPEAVLTTITNGVSDKGMPAWGPILGPNKVEQVAAYVLSKQGSAPAVPDDTPPPGDAPPADVAVADADDAPSLDGKAIYDQNCAACHGADMKGLVGPNLVDAEWIHGGELAQIRKTITEGVPEKGMIQWGPVLGDAKIELVAQYVHEQAAAANGPM